MSKSNMNYYLTYVNLLVYITSMTNDRNKRTDEIRNILRGAMSLDLPLNISKLAKKFNLSRQWVTVLKNQVEEESSSRKR